MIDAYKPQRNTHLCSLETCCLFSLFPAYQFTSSGLAPASLCNKTSSKPTNLARGHQKTMGTPCSCLWGRSLPSNGEGYLGSCYTQRRIAETLLASLPGSHSNAINRRGDLLYCYKILQILACPDFWAHNHQLCGWHLHGYQLLTFLMRVF